MPIDTTLAVKTWERYLWMRQSGHDKYVKKADRCEAFYRGEQWADGDKQRLAEQRRPALTINKIMATTNNVLGEQINNRAEISFRPARGGNSATADILAKVFKQISNNNQLDWRRSEMFADGIITSRGYLDARIEYNDSMEGEVRITNVNPKNVIPDPDGEDYDPDTWSDVLITKWLTADDIAVLYSEEDADTLRGRDSYYATYPFDSIDQVRDRFGTPSLPLFDSTDGMGSTLRNIRVLDRQHRVLDRQKHFLLPTTGDTRPIPETWGRDKIAEYVKNYGVKVIDRLVRRIRWTVVADSVVLHDDWSPYEHFTVLPFFPIFRRGRTAGLVENLLDPQELLNKVSSQELHVVNTTANSGYKVRAGALSNMSVEELEQKGAQTGVVIEVNGDPDKDVQKIQPNNVPQGLDRISFKAEDHIKTISGVNDSMQGFDREDVAARAIERKKQSGATALAKPFDNLTRTDFLLARNVLSLVQGFYTEERILTITKDSATGEMEEFAVNQVNAAGQVVNDLTLGEYEAVVTSVPHRETMEDSQFEQAMALREAGVQIPDAVIINASRLQNKAEIIKQITGDKESPEAQAQQQLQQRGAEAEVSKLEGEAAQKHADAELKTAKAQQTQVAAQREAQTPPDAGTSGPSPVQDATSLAQADREDAKASHAMQMAQMEHARKVAKDETDAQLKAAQLEQERQQAEEDRIREAAANALKARQPQTS